VIKENKKEDKDNGDDNKNSAPIEFGSSEDLLLIQAMNYLKGIESPEQEIN
jgi:carboxyl-terminal processing protease